MFVPSLVMIGVIVYFFHLTEVSQKYPNSCTFDKNI